HVISDVHGEYKKLRHVINNASGSLKPIVEEMFSNKLSIGERQQLLNLIYYPFETYEYLSASFSSRAEKVAFTNKNLFYQLELLRHLSRKSLLQDSIRVLPEDYKKVFLEI